MSSRSCFVGTEMFLKELQDGLCSDIGLSQNKLYSYKQSVVMYLSWAGRNNVSKLDDYLYGDVWDVPAAQTREVRAHSLPIQFF